ncbi:hypothetical protein [Allochromatium vinosum]|uniref:Uncharacterized protein n=1 Tax=Allochromatium vinosum (strain ATCC 17899 / DSM 180 / NBRC 103801 / NCIMB 10441 / D) TaxID=572477 RepID=D3RV15_ALLVD|nr:hypothetical protein [Allochromatium vinosum]ADC62947.1 hypothetical protein Alvin_2023 [Allochromatium vinosum DSM 180]MBK1655944.1 hypothetical protein [Allochromatium vinosum]
MMKGRNTLLVLMASGLLLSLPAQAQRGGPPGPRFDDRLDFQSSSIQRGIDSGELTRREARRLRQEQDEARQFMRDLRRDGYPPHEARRMIERRLDRVDRHIRELSRNSDVAPHYRGDRRGPPPRDYDDRRGPPPRDYDDRY